MELRVVRVDGDVLPFLVLGVILLQQNNPAAPLFIMLGTLNLINDDD